jgi:hypothetical protein
MTSLNILLLIWSTATKMKSIRSSWRWSKFVMCIALTKIGSRSMAILNMVCGWAVDFSKTLLSCETMSSCMMLQHFWMYDDLQNRNMWKEKTFTLGMSWMLTLYRPRWKQAWSYWNIILQLGACFTSGFSTDCNLDGHKNSATLKMYLSLSVCHFRKFVSWLSWIEELWNLSLQFQIASLLT